MQLTFLGTGTSTGVPLIGCDCEVCTSSDPRDKRLRSSIYLQAGATRLLVDTTPDFRQQALRYGVDHIDAVLFTHGHADHIMGFDDIRRFNSIQNSVIPAYANAATLEALHRVFPYIGAKHQPGLYVPLIDFREIGGPLRIGELDITPVPVTHGADATLGFRFMHEGHALGYVPDCLAMDDAAVDAFRGVEVMILDGLRYHPHPTHLTIDASVALLTRIGAARSLITHVSHDVHRDAADRELPDGIAVAYDGLEVSCP